MKNVRLSKYVVPHRYQLTIKPDLNGFTFEGEEVIEFGLKKSASEITLHAKELKVWEVVISIGKQKLNISPKNILYDLKSETVTFKFPHHLPKGKGELRLKFSGVLNNIMRGFYRSRYMHQGKEKHMATTQFEATDARRAFPCFDEPAQKAVFDVSLIVPKDLIAISNTLETSIAEHQSEYKIVKFAPTPKMSTYLLAFIVGDFEFIEGKTKDGVLVRVFVTPGKKHQAKFALDTAVKVLEFYNRYFDIPYPLPVLDMIAIPDFSHGAMENWGAVTYRESALLVDPEHSSASNKQWVALVIAHELAHQWFGNLVTMQWWTHLWLNEGFASYIEYLAVDKLFPSWEIWTQFAYADLGVALKLDGLKHTHPIEIEVGHPDEIGEIFDEISYSKGASVIRMLAGYLGEKNFRDGLRCYLKKHSYKNASTIHLWEAFEKVSKKPVAEIMQNWTAKAGYPVLKVTEQKGKLEISQSRFFSSPVSKNQAKDNTIWSVPVKITTNKNNSQNLLLNSRRQTISLAKYGWVKINSGESGFYRTDYPAQMLAALKRPVYNKELPALDRLALIRDAFALAESGELPTTQALELVEAYKNETDYTVWVEIAAGLSSIKNIVYGQNFYSQFELFAINIFKKQGQKLGFKVQAGENHTKGLLRSLLLHQLAAYNHLPTIKAGLAMAKNKKNILPDLRSVIYQISAQTGNKAHFDSIIKKYNIETLSEEKNRLGRALGQFKDPKLLNQALNFAMSRHVRIQDTAQIFASVWANPVGSTIAWNYTKTHWRELLKRYPSSGHMLNKFIKPAAVFTGAKLAQEIKQFFSTHRAPGAKRAVEQVLEKVVSNSEWLKRDQQKISLWLNKK